MTDERTDRREAYDRMRAAFDTLPLEDRALFLIEATASTLASGLDRAGRAAADELDDLFAGAHQRRGPSGEDKSSAEAPGPAEPETGRRQTGSTSTDKNGDAGEQS